MAKKKVKKEKKEPIKYNGSTPLKDKNQETFAALYTTAGHHYFGNATTSYAQAYGKQKRLDEIDALLETASNSYETDDDGDRVDNEPTESQKLHGEKKRIMAVCSNLGWRLLRRGDILLRTQYYLRMYLTEEAVDARRAFLINQDRDLRASESALANYDKVAGRIKGKDGDKPDKVIVEFSWLDPEPRPDAGKSRPKVAVKSA